MAGRPQVRISREDLKELDRPAIIEGVKHLASYSWIEAQVPTISVPGCPPRWSPPVVPMRLQKDTGLVYIAQNAARHPQSPLEPLFRALYVLNPEFDVRPVDVITDRNNIRKLLSFVDPSTCRNGLEPFTITAEAVDNTVILCRAEARTSEVIGPHEFKGFGHEFEKAYTHCQLSNSTGYHRIVSYRFGGINFLVRHEVDGYASTPTATSRNSMEDDGLAGLLSNLTMNSASNSSSDINSFTPPGSRMVIREEGITVPLDSTLEIKTRTSNQPLNIPEVAPQLWASQTPKLVRAYHTRGLFQRASVEDVAKEVKAWEQVNQNHLKRLAVLIKEISGAVRKFGGRAVIKYDEAADKISVMPANGSDRMLPRDLYSKWSKRDSKPGPPGQPGSSPTQRGPNNEAAAAAAQKPYY